MTYPKYMAYISRESDDEFFSFPEVADTEKSVTSKLFEHCRNDATESSDDQICVYKLLAVYDVTAKATCKLNRRED